MRSISSCQELVRLVSYEHDSYENQRCRILFMEIFQPDTAIQKTKTSRIASTSSLTPILSLVFKSSTALVLLFFTWYIQRVQICETLPWVLSMYTQLQSVGMVMEWFFRKIFASIWKISTDFKTGKIRSKIFSDCNFFLYFAATKVLNDTIFKRTYFVV